MSRFLRADVQGMHGYAVQPSAGLRQARRDGEPVPACRPRCSRALGERLGAVALNRYPAERGDELRAALADARAACPRASTSCWATAPTS